MTGRPDLSGLRRSAPASPAMVPQPPRRWRSRVLLPAGVLAAFAAVLLYAGRGAFFPGVDVHVVPVVVKTTSAVSAGSVTAQAAGWVEPDPYPIFVSGLADGVVDQVLVLEGETVEKDQVVVRLVKDDARLALEGAEARVAELTARVRTAEAVAAAAQRDWDNPVERTRAVSVGEAGLARARSEVERLAAEIAAQEARVAELSDQLKRDELQLASGAVTEFDVIQLRLRVETARAVLEALVAGRPAAAAGVDAAQAELLAARENLSLRIPETLALEKAKADLDQTRALLREEVARRDEARLRLDRMDVRSPAAGIVMRRLADPGAKMMFGMDSVHSAHALHLYDPQKLQVRVDVPLADAARVGVGQKARIVVEVLPDRTFEGVVTRVVHQADIQKNTLQVKVAVADPVPDLKPEMLARVQFVGAATAPAGDAPRTAERVFAPEGLLAASGSGRATAWIVDKGRGVAERREVSLGGARQDGWVEVVSGLLPGDVLIDDPPAGLAQGDSVHIVGEAGGAR